MKLCMTKLMRVQAKFAASLILTRVVAGIADPGYNKSSRRKLCGWRFRGNVGRNFGGARPTPKLMSILDKLASSLNRRDEVPNQLLAEEIVRSKDRSAVKELVENLQNRNRKIQSDCIKVLYEIGERSPDLIADYADEFAALLESANGRLVWGAMTALDAIASADPERISALLPKVLAGAESGSVIARDHAVGILVTLAGTERHAERCFPILLEQLETCPANQLPMYAEMSAPIVSHSNRKRFGSVLRARALALAKESQKKRVARVLKKVMA
jgi:hypothetical protein